MGPNQIEMKAKVIIEDGETSIVLTPETDFEKDIIEKGYGKTNKFSIHTSFDAQYSYSTYSKHSITMILKELKQ